jgi:arylsulfatase A-like enzyme
MIAGWPVTAYHPQMLAHSTSQPNVIVMFSDQQRWDTTGVHHNPLDLTPNFDRMARSGTDVHFSFTSQPVCGPARSEMQSGRYGTTTGCYKNGIPLPSEVKTLAHYFRAAGYATGYIGKWHLGSDDGPTVPAERGGYDYWLASNLLEFTSDAYQTRVFDNDNQPVDLPGYRVDAIMDAAIRYIDHASRSARPFYLFTSYIEPHHQNHRDDYPAPGGYAERYSGRWMPPDLAALPSLGHSAHRSLPGYLGMVKRLDEALGRMLDALRSLNQLENTIVLYTCDHGCHFKTRNDEYKRSCHESSLRVPTAFTGPGFSGGGRIQELVSLIDLPPTLLDAAGLPVPAAMQGRSLMPLLRRTAHEAWSDEVFVQISETQVGRAIRTRRWKYAVVAPGLDGNTHPASDVYVEESLYDLLADPYELNNVVGGSAYGEVTQVLRERLIRRMVQAGEKAPRIDPAPAVHSFGQVHVSAQEARM